MRKAWLVMGLVGLASVACASPKAEGRLVSRLTAAQPVRWPRPVPVGTGAGVELTEGALTDKEATRLGPRCTAEVERVVGSVAPVRRAQVHEWRLVVTRLVVDTGRAGGGERWVRARAVLEVRNAERTLAVSTAVAHLVGRRPLLGNPDADWGEVAATVESACAEAARQMLSPVQAVSARQRERWESALHAPEASTRMEAAQAIGRHQDEISAPLLVRAMEDEDASVRRLAAWSLGELGFGAAAGSLAFMAETDPDYSVRVEAVSSLGKLLAVDSSLRSTIREGRERGRQARQARESPDASTPGDADSPARVLEIPDR